MIAMGDDLAGEWPIAAGDAESMGALGGHTNRAEIGDDDGDSIALLHAELGGAGDDRVAFGMRCDAGDQGNSSISVGNLGAPIVVPTRRPGSGMERRDLFPPRSA